MTRINLLPPRELADQHLMAEYRELPMIMGSLKRSLKSPKGLPKISTLYTLNKGHVGFFYNKGKFLHKRYLALIVELELRGYKLSGNRQIDFQVFVDNNLYLDWKPTKEEIATNKERIDQRISAKPLWYKHYGQPLNLITLP